MTAPAETSNADGGLPPDPADAAPAAPSQRRGIRGVATFRILLQVSTAVVIGVSMLAYFGRWNWFLELFTHFRVQYSVFALVAAGLFLLFRHWGSASIAILAVALNAWPAIPRLAGEVGEPTPTQLSLLSINVLRDNDDHAAVLRVIRERGADVVLIQELSAEWEAALGELESEYPHRLLRPQEDNFGIGLYSRLPFTRSAVEQWGSSQYPSLDVSVESPLGVVRVIGAHPPPPVSSSHARQRDYVLDRIAGVIAQAPKRSVLLGDLNTTPWAPRFADLLVNGKLTDSGRGFGVKGTWPAGNWLLQVPIDHCLVTHDLVAHRYEVGEAIGSDHLPLYVELRERPTL